MQLEQLEIKKTGYNMEITRKPMNLKEYLNYQHQIIFIALVLYGIFLLKPNIGLKTHLDGLN